MDPASPPSRRTGDDVYGNENDDWIKTLSWDVWVPQADPPRLVETLDDLRAFLGADVALEHFLSLPVATPMPAKLRQEIERAGIRASAVKRSRMPDPWQHGTLERKALESAQENIVGALEQVFVQDVMDAFSTLALSASELVPHGISVNDGIAATLAKTAVAEATPQFDQAFSEMQRYATDRALNIAQAVTSGDPSRFRAADVLRTIDAAHRSRLQSLLPELQKQTTAAIVSAVRDNIENGRHPLDAKKTIQRLVGGSSMYPGLAASQGDEAALRHRAAVIARTEVAWARNNANISFLEAAEDVEQLYVVDGDDCGWTSHDDPEKANGKHVTFEMARNFPIAHPNCRRSFGPVYAPFKPSERTETPEPPVEPGEGQLPGEHIELSDRAHIKANKEQVQVMDDGIAALMKALPGIRIPDGVPALHFGAGDLESQLGGKGNLGVYLRNNANGTDYIQIDSKTAITPQSVSTFIHEYGHFLDYRVLDGHGTSMSIPATAQAQGHVGSVLRAAYRTQSIRNMIKLSNDADYEAMRTYAKYATKDVEIWARAFDQYVSERSGSAALRSVYERAGFTQWAEEDFAPIRKAMDAMFKDLGWIG
jgi:hypothetical protein